MPRKILHLDLDAFFCAVEEKRDPPLRGKAFVVGGRPGARGVVLSVSSPTRSRRGIPGCIRGRLDALCKRSKPVRFYHIGHGEHKGFLGA
ncbi:MAG: hypothetical protein M1281_15565 [Chloroflexi bacterium]|nr:hypothetical protein [Chloroflexota bacterium]